MSRTLYALLFIATIGLSSCGIATLDNGYTIEAKLATNAAAIDFTIHFPVWGYVGIDFGQSMTNVDIITIEVNSTGGINVVDKFAKTIGPPATDVSLGGTNDVSNVTITKNRDGSHDASFRRPLITTDQFDFKILPTVNYPIAFAWKEKSATAYHGAQVNLFHMVVVANDVIFTRDPPAPSTRRNILLLE